MSYTHHRVDKLVAATKAIVDNYDQSLIAGMETIDGLVVVPELIAFCKEIRKFNPHARFGAGTRKRLDGNSVGRYEEVFVYKSEHKYAMAKIGFADYLVSASKSKPPKYVIFAQSIRNDKYHVNRDQFYMVAADSLEKAVKNAKKYLRSYTTLECAEMSMKAVAAKFHNIGYAASRDERDARSEITSEARLLRTELFHMLDMGHPFLLPELREKVIKWRTAYKAEQAMGDRTLHAYYVNARAQGEVMLFDVIEVLDVNKRTRPLSAAGGIPVTTYKMEDLPEKIAGGIATLSILGNGQYVDEVGMRIDDTSFWVQR